MLPPLGYVLLLSSVSYPVSPRRKEARIYPPTSVSSSDGPPCDSMPSLSILNPKYRNKSCAASRRVKAGIVTGKHDGTGRPAGRRKSTMPRGGGGRGRAG